MNTRHKADQPFTRTDYIVGALVAIGFISAALILVAGFGGFQ
jgi:hypothetical protein